MKRYPLILVAVLIMPLLHGCANYGKEKTYNGVELYHTEKVTDAESEQLGNYLVSSKFADGNAKTVQITKSGDTYQFRFVVKAGTDKDTELFKTFKYFASMLSAQVFSGSPVELDICDDHLNTLKSFTSDDYGKEKVFNATQLFHTKNVTNAEVDSLGNYLIRTKFADGKPKSVQLAKLGSTYQFRFVVRKGIDKDPEYLENAKVFASELSAKVFNGATVEVHMCDEFLNTLAVVPMR